MFKLNFPNGRYILVETELERVVMTVVSASDEQERVETSAYVSAADTMLRGIARRESQRVMLS